VHCTEEEPVHDRLASGDQVVHCNDEEPGKDEEVAEHREFPVNGTLTALGVHEAVEAVEPMDVLDTDCTPNGDAVPGSEAVEEVMDEATRELGCNTDGIVP